MPCFVQDHNTISLWPGLETAPLDPETSELTMRHRASIVLQRKKRKCEDSFIILLTVCQKFTKICGEIEKERKRWIAEVLLFISQEISTNLPTKSCKVNYKKPFCRPLADWRTGDKEEIIERDRFLFLITKVGHSIQLWYGREEFSLVIKRYGEFYLRFNSWVKFSKFMYAMIAARLFAPACWTRHLVGICLSYFITADIEGCNTTNN